MSEKIIAFLRDVSIFRTLDLHSLGHIAESLRPFEIEAGEELICAGDDGADLYIVKEGRLDVRTPGDNTVIGEISSGEIVGEKALLTREPRSATVRSLSSVKGYALSKNKFLRIVDKHPDEMEIIANLIASRHRNAEKVRFRPPRKDVIGMLKGIDLFSSLDEVTLGGLEPYFQWSYLPRGEELIRQGETGKQLYIVLTGRLKYESRNSEGDLIREGSLTKGDVVGEMSLLIEEPRSATVSAARDSEILTLSPSSLTDLMLEHPKVLLELTRTLARRLNAGIKPQRKSETQSIALIPLQTDADEFSRLLTEAFTYTNDIREIVQFRTGDVITSQLGEHIDNAIDSGKTPIAIGRNNDEKWNAACVGHCDKVLLLVDSNSRPELSALELKYQFTGELVFLGSPADKLDVAEFLRHRRKWTHHNLRRDNLSDLHRLVRFLTGRTVGVALGGGGARGLAHIGVIQALKEARIPIDLVVGTSIGALVGAALALDQSVEEMRAAAWKYLVVDRPFRDPVLPLVSLLKGRKITNGIRRYSGDVQIEEMPIRYSAVTADLRSQDLVVMDNGPLWKAIRSSVAIPGLIPPVYDQGRLLADGGLINNAPVDIAINRGADTTILIDVSGTAEPDQQAVDSLANTYGKLPTGWSPGFAAYLRSRIRKEGPWTGIAEVMTKSLLMGSQRSTIENRKIADIYLKLPVAEIGMLNFNALDQLIELGYQSAIKEVDNWKEIIKKT